MSTNVKNHWLDAAKKKQVFKEIDELAMDVWGNDGTLADLFAVLNDEQTDFLMNMMLKDFGGDADEFSFGIEVIAP
jgi:hypothetical protein